jgi:L-lysine 2,3-aminomutase
MITRNPPSWQRLLAEGYGDCAPLFHDLRLPAEALPGALAAARTFRLRLPRGLAAALPQGDPAHPVLRQFLPAGEELTEQPGFHDDPLGEGDAVAVPGLLHKYAGRALLLVTGACAVHCRYCFRRHFPYGDHAGRDWGPALTYLRETPEVRELILSGGDPLMLPDPALGDLLGALREIPHLRRLRLHTRMPVALPERITPQLLALLGEHPQRTLVVIHCNHPDELTPPVGEALEALSRRRIPLLNQAVLLRGVNDTADTLAELSERLFACGVLPYYLHRLDPVRGAAHFAVPAATALALQQALQARLPGYLVPRLVREIPGAPGKVAVCGQAGGPPDGL